MRAPALPWRARLVAALSELAPDPGAVSGTPAAVLVAVFVADDQPWCWLMRRAAHLRQHPGQVSLPGGKPEPGDAGLLATALREAHEEIGLEPAAVDVLGEMPPRLTSTRFRVTPFVGLIAADFRPIVQPGEVGRAFAAPLRLFTPDGALRVPPTAPERGPVPSYLTDDGEVVWGATAAILHRLAAALGP
ncbi:MAG: CoA pyrophosphatase [Myxococcales bacterium]|nr:MAG: CoA pyrophosphatase [Myxococcales bacterium]